MIARSKGYERYGRNTKHADNTRAQRKTSALSIAVPFDFLIVPYDSERGAACQ